MKKKSKGGKRAGAGRPKMPETMETVSIRVKTSDVKKWGGRDKLRIKLCEFVAFPSSFNQVAFYEPGKGITEVRDLKEGEAIPPAQISLGNRAASPRKPQERPKTTVPDNTTAKDGNAKIEAEIAQLEKELKSPPQNPLIGIKAWKAVRQQKIQELKNQLK